MRPQWPRLQRDWPESVVKTLVELRNSLIVIPKGTICKISGTYQGKVDLETESCRCCGIKGHIIRVSADLVEMLEPPQMAKVSCISCGHTFVGSIQSDGAPRYPCPKCGSRGTWPYSRAPLYKVISVSPRTQSKPSRVVDI